MWGDTSQRFYTTLKKKKERKFAICVNMDGGLIRYSAYWDKLDRKRLILYIFSNTHMHICIYTNISLLQKGKIAVWRGLTNSWEEKGIKKQRRNRKM